MLGSSATQNDVDLLAVHNSWDLVFNWKLDSYLSQPLNNCIRNPRLFSVVFEGMQSELNSLTGIFAASVLCPCGVSVSAQH